MNGHVNDRLRALIPIQVGVTNVHETQEIFAWIDTAFNGSLVIPKAKIGELGLVKESSAEAILADGKKVELETFGCRVKWFGKSYDTQVIVNESEDALLDTILLAGHRLEEIFFNSSQNWENRRRTSDFGCLLQKLTYVFLRDRCS